GAERVQDQRALVGMRRQPPGHVLGGQQRVPVDVRDRTHARGQEQGEPPRLLSGRSAVGGPRMQGCWACRSYRWEAGLVSMTMAICSSGTARMWYICVGSNWNRFRAARWSFHRLKTDSGITP